MIDAPDLQARPQFTCPECSAVSHNPNDIAERYCGRCHWWTGDPELAAANPSKIPEEAKT